MGISERGRYKIRYKAKVYLGLVGVAFILISVLTIYNLLSFRSTLMAQSKEETGYISKRIVAQIDERLENLWQYYSNAVTEEDVVWLLENNLHFSDYNYYHSAQEKFADSKIFGDYISGYAFINYKTGWVISNKGIYKAGEIINKDEIRNLYQTNNEFPDKNYWFYNSSREETNKLSREYRKTIETQGLDIVLKLPSHSIDINGMLVVQIDMDLWKKWGSELLGENEELIVTEDNGKVIFSSDSTLTEAFLKKADADFFVTDNARYAVSHDTSSILGWKYYVMGMVPDEGFFSSKLAVWVVVVFSVIALGSALLLGYMFYSPVDKLIKNVSDNKNRIRGNELEYLADRIRNIKSNQLMLEAAIDENRSKILHLFELRLLRGEIKNEDEWNDYFSRLNIPHVKFFATAVIVLKQNEDIQTNDYVVEESACITLADKIPKEINELTWMPVIYDSCAMFCILGKDTQEELVNSIVEFNSKMQNFVSEEYEISVIIGISATHTEYRHIHAAYRESISALTAEETENSVSMNDDSCRLYLASMTERTKNHDLSFETDLQYALKAVDKEQSYIVADSFSEYMKKCGNHDDVIYITLRIINAALETATVTNLNLSEVFPQGIRRLYRDAVEVTEYSRIRRYLKYAVIDPILAAREKMLQNDSVGFLEKVESLIESHNGNITLQECSDELKVHPTYIWKILKMEKNKSFSELIENYKLEKAKEMLIDSDISVNDIAEMLGYTNAQNFIRFFNKGAGMTPGKYRKLYC